MHCLFVILARDLAQKSDIRGQQKYDHAQSAHVSMGNNALWSEVIVPQESMVYMYKAHTVVSAFLSNDRPLESLPRAASLCLCTKHLI